MANEGVSQKPLSSKILANPLSAKLGPLPFAPRTELIGILWAFFRFLKKFLGFSGLIVIKDWIN